MAIDKVGGAAPAGRSPALESGKEKFGEVLEGTGRAEGAGALRGGGGQRPSEVEPRRVVDGPQRTEALAKPGCVSKPARVAEARAVPRVERASAAAAGQPAQMLDRVSAAQQRLEQILSLAQSGKSFTPAELIAMQAQVYRASQELELAGKVVEKATGGVKQVLQTQL